MKAWASGLILGLLVTAQTAHGETPAPAPASDWTCKPSDCHKMKGTALYTGPRRVQSAGSSMAQAAGVTRPARAMGTAVRASTRRAQRPATPTSVALPRQQLS